MRFLRIPNRAAWRRAAISALLSLTLATASHAAAPTLSFTDTEIQMTAAQAGKIVYFGIAREFYDDGVTITPYSGIGEAKAGESVVVTPRRGVAVSALWAGIDLASGAVALSYPDGGTPNLTIGGNPKSGLQKLEVETSYVYLLLVRPGVGAWISRAGDGSPSDDDGLVDGKLGALLSGMAPVGTSPAVPLAIAANDVVLGVNPNTFDVFAAGVTE